VGGWCSWPTRVSAPFDAAIAPSTVSTDPADLPAIFSSYVTGGITAAGGAWNASIVAEVVT
jgi:hypothetical protein